MWTQLFVTTLLASGRGHKYKSEYGRENIFPVKIAEILLQIVVETTNIFPHIENGR